MTTALLIRILRQDHEEIDKLFATLIAATTRVDRDRLRERVVDEMCKLFAAEESVVYSALKRAGTAPQMVERMLEQHTHLRQALETMNGQAPEAQAFENTAKSVRRLFNEHSAEVEQLVFPQAQNDLAPQLDSLAVEMEHARQREHGAYGV